MATQEYWSAVEEKSLRRNEVACAWFLVLAAVAGLQIITSMAATPFCGTKNKAAVAESAIQPTTTSARADRRILAAADQQPCRRR